MTQARQTVGQSPYRAFITREPFLFYEMRTTARLLAEGMTEDEAIERITRENLFQYPTERSLRGMARACVRRLRTLGIQRRHRIFFRRFIYGFRLRLFHRRTGKEIFRRFIFGID